MLRSQAAPTGPSPLLCSRPLFLPRRRRAVLLSPCPAGPRRDAGCSRRGHQPWRQRRWQEGALGTCSSLPARRVPPAGPREGPVGRAECRPVELPWASKASGPAPGGPPACTRSVLAPKDGRCPCRAPLPARSLLVPAPPGSVAPQRPPPCSESFSHGSSSSVGSACSSLGKRG